MDRRRREKKVSINALISIRQYMALNELVERGVFPSISEAVRAGVEEILKRYKETGAIGYYTLMGFYNAWGWWNDEFTEPWWEDPDLFLAWLLGRWFEDGEA